MVIWTTPRLIIAVVMVGTGSINTLSAKWADESYADGIRGINHKFDHPYLQACGMFMGEMLCLVAFGVLRAINRKNANNAVAAPSSSTPTRRFNPFVFLAPAMCDMIATSLMYVGLTLTFASSFQMLRGAVIIFTGLLSVAFLGRVLKPHEWIGMAIIILGLFSVGLSDIVSGNVKVNDINGVITGDLLIITAQIIAASQMVIEEKFVGKHNVPPLLAVGCEGTFGFIILGLLLIPMYYIPAGEFGNNPDKRLEDAIDGFTQLGNSWQIALATFGNVFSIAFFNFAGISVTKEISATTRMVLDSVRTLFIWIVSLSVSWQKFHWLQVVGFVALIFGMCVYNEIVTLSSIKTGRLWAKSTDSETEAFVEDDANAHHSSVSVNAEPLPHDADQENARY